MHAIECWIIDSRRTYYSLVVLHHGLTIAVCVALARSLIEAMRITVVAPCGLRSKLLRHLQSLFHEYSAVLFEATLRLLFDSSVAPIGMSLTFQLYGQGFVGFERGPILSEDWSPAFEVYHANTAKRPVRDLLDQVLPEYLEVFFQITFLRNATVSFCYNS